MKKALKLMTLVCATAMLLFALAGCGGYNPETDQPTGPIWEDVEDGGAEEGGDGTNALDEIAH